MGEDEGALGVGVRVVQQLGLDGEAGSLQPGGDQTRPAVVEVEIHRVTATSLRLVPAAVAGVEAEQHDPAGPQHPVELGENGGHLVVGDVDQGEPGEHPGQRTVGEVESGHGTDLEAQAGMIASGHLDHPGREVDAEHVEADAIQVAGEPAGPAADVGDRPVPLGTDQLGEEGQDAALERLTGQGVAQQVRITDRHGVVRGTGLFEPAGNAHAEHRSPTRALGGVACTKTWYSIAAMAWGGVELEPEVEKWLESLPTALFARAAFYVDLLAEYGPLLGEPYTKQLDGKLRELRFHLERQAVRVTYWIASDKRIILLTVFYKTRMRDEREVARACRALVRCVDEAHRPEE